MRFHIGFSKRISIKKLIEFIGFLFIALLSFFGIYQSANAETLDTWNNIYATSSNFDFYSYDYIPIVEGEQSQLVSVNSSNIENSDYYFRKNCDSYVCEMTLNNKESPTTNGPQFFNISNGSISYFNAMNGNQYINKNRILQSFKIKYIPSNSLCQNDNSKSMNMLITYTKPLLNYQNADIFNLSFTDNDDLLAQVRKLRVVAHSSSNNRDTLFVHNCEFSPSNSNDGHFTYICNNIFKGNEDYTIDYYLFELLNGNPFNNIYSSTTTNAYVSDYNVLSLAARSSEQKSRPFKYSCVSDEPVFAPGEEGSSEDPAGLNDIYDLLKDNYNSNLPGINTNSFVDIPSNFSDLLLLPLNVINAIISNSTGTCSSYSIDMSSIVSKWGNVNDTYYLQLPCMREVLSNKLGSIYVICDMLFCFILFYNIAMHVVRLINAITYGEDLFTIFYQPTEPSVMLQSSSAGGSYTRQRQWFE